MKTVLLSLVGMNPASALVALRVLEPDRVVLVHTRRTAAKAEALERLCAPRPVKRVEWSISAGIESLAGRVAAEVALQPDEALTVDLTGATTVFSLGVWDGLTAAFGRRFDAVYLRQSDSRLCDARTAEVLEKTPPDIRPKEVLALFGAKPSKVVWAGRLRQMPRRIHERLPLYRALCANWQPRRVQKPAGSAGVRVARTRLPKVLPAGFQHAQGVLSCPTDPGCLTKNQWLEEYCLAVAVDALGRPTEVQGALGLEVRPGDAPGANDEGDVVLVRGGRVVVIEAKAGLKSDGLGAEVQKRVQKARRFYGSQTRVVVVCPVWGAAPPPALAGVMAHHAVLVGNDEAMLKREIRRALGGDGA